MTGAERADAPEAAPRPGSFSEVFWVFLKLGLTSFGGPVAHLGYFRRELILRRKWLDDQSYADLVALCQVLPGPASSQTGIGLGVARAGIPGGFAAWLGFTLPSALALIAFAYGVRTIGNVADAGWLRGLELVAVAVVAQAVWGMATTLCPDRPRVTVAIIAAGAALIWPSSWAQVLIIIAGGFSGWWFSRGAPVAHPRIQSYRSSRRLGSLLLVVFFGLLLGLPLLREATGSFSVAVFDAFYRAGSLVFGGGHVVLPLLQAEVVPPGWVNTTTFTAGYGAAQAVPGPLFTFSAFLGAAMQPGLAGLTTGLLALIAIFTPSFLLFFGVLPFWDSLRALAPVQAALRGVNAAVVGILLAALYDPVWTSAVATEIDVALALGAFLVLSFWRWPVWLVVLLMALVGGVLGSVG